MANLRAYSKDFREPLVEGTPLKRAFKDKEASLYIGMSESWLRHIRLEGARLDHLEGPRFIKVGRSVRYLKEDLDTWLENFQRWQHLAQHDTQSG